MIRSCFVQAARDIFRDHQDEWSTLRQRCTCISCRRGAWEEIELEDRFFFLSLRIAFARASASRRRRGVKVPGHVANQRRSLCGTKKITVTRLTTHGDTVVLTYRVAYTRTHSRASGWSKLFTLTYIVAPRAIQCKLEGPVRLRLRHSSPPYVRVPAYRSAFKMTLPRDAYRTPHPVGADIVETFSRSDHFPSVVVVVIVRKCKSTRFPFFFCLRTRKRTG